MPCAVEQSKVAAELEFWRDLYAEAVKAAPDGFAQIRCADLKDYARNFPEIYSEKGFGLDLGCGPWSVFEYAYMQVVAADPLLPEYRKFIEPPRQGVYYHTIHTEGPNADRLQFADGFLDWVWCVNVIDHTPNPERMLAEVRRVLKPGGKFYFAVWFDPALYAPHYRLWNRATVDAYLKDFKLLRATEEWWAEHQKYRYWGLYE